MKLLQTTLLICLILTSISACINKKDQCLKKLDIPSCRSLCDTQQMDGCNQLARALNQHSQKERYRPEVTSLFEKACSGQLGVACYNRAQLCNTDGFHFADKKAKLGIVCARKWYSLACQNGWEPGCSMSQSFNATRFGQ